MGTYTECLKGVIGLSKSECICYNAGDLPEYGESKSGLFMTDYLFGLPLSYPAAAYECDEPSLWDLLVEAREQGILRFMSEFGRAAQSAGRYKQKYSAYTGKVGGEKYTAGMPQAEYHIMELCAKVPSSTMIINSITVRATGAETQVVNVLVLTEEKMNANDLTDPYGKLTGTYSAAGVAVCTDDTNGPLRLDFATHDKLYVMLPSGSVITPRNTKFERTVQEGCGCGGGKQKVAGWDTYLTASSYPLTDLPDHESAIKDTIYTNGIQLDVQFACDAYFLCEGMDFETDAFGRVVAELLVLYSNRQLIGYMLASDKINVYTAARSEELIEKDAMLQIEIDERLEWAASNLPQGASTCYRCFPRQRRRSNLV